VGNPKTQAKQFVRRKRLLISYNRA